MPNSEQELDQKSIDDQAKEIIRRWSKDMTFDDVSPYFEGDDATIAAPKGPAGADVQIEHVVNQVDVYHAIRRMLAEF